MPAEWPSCYFHKEKQMFLIIYVDDFKMAGPKGNFVGAWESITSQGIRLDEPAPLDHFLGCRHHRTEIIRKDGVRLTVMEYDFESSLRNSIVRYEALAAECGASVSKRLRKTPYRSEPEHHHRLPAKAGPCVACPWCKNQFAPEDFKQYKSCKELVTEFRSNKMKIKAAVEELKETPVSQR